MLILASNKLAASRQVMIPFSLEGIMWDVRCRKEKKRMIDLRIGQGQGCSNFKPVLHNLHKPDCGENKLIVNTMPIHPV
jgi:hypothetical protein